MNPHAGNGLEVDVDLYPVEADQPTPAVLVCPGGGFREHTAHDGEGYARWFNTLGVAAVVVRYQLVPDPFPLALLQVRSVLDALQSGALLPHVDADKTGVIGSSAGGLLAGLLATGTVLSIEHPALAVPRCHDRRSTSSPTVWPTSPFCLPPQSKRY